MRKMKDSGVEWIGEIPEEWVVSRIRYLITAYKAGPFGSSLITSELLPEGNILVYTPEHIAVKSTENINNLFLPSSRRYEMAQFMVSKGEFIFPIVGSLGRAFIVTNDMPDGIINQRLAKFKVRKENIDLDYFAYLFTKSNFFNIFIENNSRGAVIVNLTKSIIGNIPILLPPSMNEQNRIANYLNTKDSEIDALISDIEKQITTLEQYKRSVITEAVTKGLDPAVPMKDSGIEWIGEIPSHWGLEKLKYKTKIRNESGKFFPEDKYIGLENVESYTGRYLPTDTVYDEAVYDIYRQGDILFGKLRPYLAKVFITEDNGFCTGEFAVIKDYKGYLRFLFYYLLSDGFLKIVNASTYGAKMPRANWDFIKNLPVPTIPSDEERCIADYLDSKCSEIDSAISLKKQQIEALNDYKKSLIYEYVTGKKEIPA